ncbi:MAG: hypothetical protein MR316_11005, partial [Lachnospiraceae bacterium]|nr:hypothetical protein [Lachnospiraceae bacterium]
PVQQAAPAAPQAAPAPQATPVQQAEPAPQAAPVQQAAPAPQAAPAQQTAATVDAAAQNSATLKANLEQQIMEDLKKNNYSDASVVRANRKYREMVKKGIMTQEECNAKMHELLPMEEAEDPLGLEAEDAME